MARPYESWLEIMGTRNTREIVKFDEYLGDLAAIKQEIDSILGVDEAKQRK